MAQYIVERYLPGVTPEDFVEVQAQIAFAASEVASAGVDLRYVGSTFIPDEETCFCRFESASPDDVRLACALAGVPFARIAMSRDFSGQGEEEKCAS